MRWVNRNKSLRKQLEKYAVDGARNAELRLGVQYYVTDVTKLQHEITRFVVYSSCVCVESMYVCVCIESMLQVT